MRSTLFLLFVALLLGSAIAEKIVSCYVRPEIPPSPRVDPFLCTHLMLIGAASLRDDGSAKLPDAALLRPIVALKKQNERLRIFVTLLPENRVMSALVTSPNLTEAFVRDVTAFMLDGNVDGFDIDWEFPVWSDDAKPSDRKGFSTLLRSLRSAFDVTPRRLGLSLAVSAPFTITKKAYDVAIIDECADFVQIMNYDFHFFAKHTPFTGLNAPLFALKYEFFILKKLNSAYSTLFWLSQGLSADKLVFGIPTYGRGFRLLSDDLHFPYSPATGVSDLFGDFVSFPQVCTALNSSSFVAEWNEHAKSPYFHGRKQWVSFENVRSVAAKAAHAKKLGIRGIMIFDLANDDFDGSCGLGGAYPLIRTAKEAFIGSHNSCKFCLN
ncbi:hypothetical protein QR680_012755 [Steinernema hermaphroditum]|uniref:GH18 domain-containing protein n=1 Tax=Steinernema hermaphroditum TaxID=289476 RepID=A0AA39M1A3_9BILA|nr:hypothetical protein QR680_012755 [Steinernema hermaphroditum]